eukprot:TRINITY_DN11333_c0_g2_i1.p1 TRINITY_DN11333_c0_g2~~TRINITY_DN11333_c0_g2_i1.p1  ORF type:complete len:658 (-),score=115.37 TRINITY_DN11333_c0_g2_i1:140-2113(-)
MFDSCPSAIGWLHSVHYCGPVGQVSAWLSDAEALRCSETRRGALENVANRAAMGQRLSVGKPTEEINGNVDMPADSKMVSFSRSRPSLVVSSGRRQVHIPLLLSDIVYAAVPGCSADVDPSHENGVSGRVTAGFVIVIGPRADNSSKTFEQELEEEEEGEESEEGDDEEEDLANGLGERLPSRAWLLCVGNCDSVGLQRILFELGSFGALRWDLQQSYRMTKHALGSGACGAVWLGQAKNAIINPNNVMMDKLGVPQVAMKLLSNFGMEVEATVRKEVNILAKVQGHPNINSLFGVFCYWEEGAHVRDSSPSGPADTPDSEPSQQQADLRFRENSLQMPRLRWCIVLSLGTDGDLFDFVRVRGVLSQTTGVQMMIGIFSALNHLHNRCIVHRDVKCANILVSRCQPMLADFGIAANLFDCASMREWKGTPGYAAPEVVSRQPYDERADIFSAGVVMYAILGGKTPFDDRDLQSVLRKTVRCKVSFRHEQFQALSRSLLVLLKKLLAKDPDGRPVASLTMEALMSFTERVEHNTAGQDSNLRSSNGVVNVNGRREPQNIFQILRAASRQSEQGPLRRLVLIPEDLNLQSQEVAGHQQPQGTDLSPSEVPRWHGIQGAPPLQSPALSQQQQQQQEPAQCSASVQILPPNTTKPCFIRRR